MSELNITLPNGVTLTFAQAMALHEVIDLLGGPEMCEWHPNDCRCCVTVHAKGNGHQSGYIIGSDGEYDWVRHSGCHE